MEKIIESNECIKLQIHICGGSDWIENSIRNNFFLIVFTKINKIEIGGVVEAELKFLFRSNIIFFHSI